jgi:hypothetical protein
VSTYSEDRADAADRWLETRIAAWQAHQAGEDEGPDDGPYHYPQGAEMEPS